MDTTSRFSQPYRSFSFSVSLYIYEYVPSSCTTRPIIISHTLLSFLAGKHNIFICALPVPSFNYAVGYILFSFGSIALCVLNSPNVFSSLYVEVVSFRFVIVTNSLYIGNSHLKFSSFVFFYCYSKIP